MDYRIITVMTAVLLCWKPSVAGGLSDQEVEIDPLLGSWTVEQSAYPSPHRSFVFSDDGTMMILDDRNRVWEQQIITDRREGSFYGTIVYVSENHHLQEIAGSTVYSDFEFLDEDQIRLSFYDNEKQSTLYIGFLLTRSPQDIVPLYDTVEGLLTITPDIIIDFDENPPHDRFYRNGGSLAIRSAPAEVAAERETKSGMLGLIEIPAGAHGTPGSNLPKASFVAYHSAPLKDTITSYQMHIIGDGVFAPRTPYVVYAVDVSEYTDQDCYVIGKRIVGTDPGISGSIAAPTGEWMEGRLDSRTPVHVWGWRKNLGGKFTPSSYRPFGELIGIPIDDELTWGDLQIEFVEICAGVSAGSAFTAYVDDIVIGRPGVSAPTSVEETIAALFRNFLSVVDRAPDGGTLGIVPFFSTEEADAEFCSLIDEQARRVFTVAGFTVPSRQSTTRKLAKEGFTQESMIDTERAWGFGEVLGTRYLVTGYILRIGSSLQVFARILDVQNQSVISSEQISLPIPVNSSD